MTSPDGARRREIIGGLALALAVALGFGILAGFFGDRVYLFDTMAQFRAHASVAILVVAGFLVWTRLFAAALASICAGGLGLATVLPFLLPLPQDGTALPGSPRYTLLQMNLRFDAPDKAAALRLIGERLPDVVTVQEMTGSWERAFAGILDRYPYQYFCAYPEHDGDAGILSRRPFAEGDAGVCDPFGAFAAKRIDFNGTQVVIGSQHLRWPWPGRQWRQVKALAPKLAGLGDPLIIAGDFNSAPWTASMRAMAAASNTRVIPGIGPTWFLEFMPSFFARTIGLPIDNVLASDGISILSVERTEATTSEHLPVLVTFTPRFARPQEPAVQTVAR
ncbi:endonuclease/exonuclease/phosphatase [Aureimonas sp. SA4125]|uniref:endonuclease/exonuclease/phosphatase family protein n=1 Tax=Aureimonas sp. SA4125 TaxID=2826993 RepID=UPI001CC81598|nr:endonuclease/exonuclease/phosphatase family protein [Aureimonas sp. SA4125]BDA83745.1 endonuclease/exonuclease/phosphatase [Aureimonas sp. SA4125]